MKKLLLFLFLFGLVDTIKAQSNEEYWARWDSNYAEVEVLEIIEYEKGYAAGVEKDTTIAPYYSRIDKYQFMATYIGKEKPIELSLLQSMARVLNLHGGNEDMLDILYENLILFKIGDQEFWLPIQAPVLKYMKEELKSGDELQLYAIFLNEHTSENILYNTLMVSEYR